jgi:putative hydrolase of the HAD superfamily
VPATAVLLDLYDTLVNGDWTWWRATLAGRLGVAPEALSEAYRATRVPRNTGGFADQAGDMTAVVQAVGIEPEPSLIDELVTMERSFSREHVTLYPDALSTVQALRARGVATALVSNCSHNTDVVVEHFGLDRVFDAVVLSFRVGSAKPDPAIYRTALDAVGARASDALFVDDQADYVDGAAALGIDARLILRLGALPPEGISEADGRATVEDLTTLVDLVVG